MLPGTALPPVADPQLVAALDSLGELMPPKTDDRGAPRRVTAGTAEWDDLRLAVSRVQSAIERSPRWPLLAAILRHINPLSDRLASGTDVVITLAEGHDYQVLAWSAHEQLETRRTRWDVPVPSYALLTSL